MLKKIKLIDSKWLMKKMVKNNNYKKKQKNKLFKNKVHKKIQNW